MVSMLFGNPLSGVTGALGDKEEKDGDKEKNEEEEAELAEARREAEEKRNDKYRKMEEERETMRQGIRDKYGIKKKEVLQPVEDPGMEGRLGRKKKTAEELEAEASDDPEEGAAKTSMFPKNLDDLKAKVTELPGTVMTTVSGVQEKCSIQ